MASLFDTLQTQAFRAGITARTKSSSKWFQKKVGELETFDWKNGVFLP